MSLSIVKSVTLEDVFNDYNINKSPLNYKISSMFQGCCNCISKYKCIVHSQEHSRRKIKKSLSENLQIKHYIKIGEECSICYEGIYTRRDAFLTDCGHSYHYSCIIKYDYANSFIDDGVYCPLCRQDMGGYMDIKDRFSFIGNNLDRHDEFEFNNKFKLPKVCYDISHYSFNNHFNIMRYATCRCCRRN